MADSQEFYVLSEELEISKKRLIASQWNPDRYYSEENTAISYWMGRSCFLTWEDAAGAGEMVRRNTVERLEKMLMLMRNLKFVKPE